MLVIAMKNKYIHRSKISEAKFWQLIRCFCLYLNACQTSSLTHLNRNTINRYFHLVRKRVANFCELEYPFQGEIEVGESYFSGKWIKGKRGRGAFRKTPVFGMLQRNGKVYTEIVPNCAKATLKSYLVYFLNTIHIF